MKADIKTYPIEVI